MKFQWNKRRSPCHFEPLINNFHHTMTIINHLCVCKRSKQKFLANTRQQLIVCLYFSRSYGSPHTVFLSSWAYNRFGCPGSFIPLIISHTPWKWFFFSPGEHWNQTLWHALSDSFRSITRTDNLGSFIHHQRRRRREKKNACSSSSKKKRDCWWLPAIYWKSFIMNVEEDWRIEKSAHEECVCVVRFGRNTSRQWKRCVFGKQNNKMV